MSPIDFNPTPPPSDPDRDHKAEARRADEDKRVEQAAAFKQAMLRRPPGAPGAPGAAGRPTLPAAPAPAKPAASVPSPKPAAPPRGAASTSTARAASSAAGTTGGASAAAAGNPSSTPAAAGARRREAESFDGADEASLLGASSSRQDEVEESGFAAGSRNGGDKDTAIPAPGAAGTGNNTRQRRSQEQSGDEGGDARRSFMEGKAEVEKGKPRRDSESPGKKPAAAADAAAGRIDLASIVPSFPTPQPTAAPAPALTAPPRTVNTALLEQIVQFAAVGHNSLGQAEMHMGLAIGAKTRVGVRLTACGQRRIRLCFSGLAQSDLIGESQINALVDSLRGRDIEVTEMVLE